MKTMRLHYRQVTGALLLTCILLATSCSENQKKPGGADSTVAGEKAGHKAPAMDLHTAVFMGNLNAVKQHVEAGTDLNKKDDYGSTALISASLFGKTEIAQTLIAGGADVNLKNNEGSTPLHVAAFFGRTAIVRSLLEQGADKSLQNMYGSTPYESVAGPFDEVKAIYDQFRKDLSPLGLKLDYEYLENVRPEIAALLK